MCVLGLVQMVRGRRSVRKSRVPFSGVTINPSFDFFPLRVALNTHKMEH